MVINEVSHSTGPLVFGSDQHKRTRTGMVVVVGVSTMSASQVSAMFVHITLEDGEGREEFLGVIVSG